LKLRYRHKTTKRGEVKCKKNMRCKDEHQKNSIPKQSLAAERNFSGTPGGFPPLRRVYMRTKSRTKAKGATGFKVLSHWGDRDSILEEGTKSERWI